MLQDIYTQCLAHSGQYPEIDWDTWFTLIESCQRQSSDGGAENSETQHLSQSQIELLFIIATRNDGIKGMKGSLCRGEFLEA